MRQFKTTITLIIAAAMVMITMTFGCTPTADTGSPALPSAAAATQEASEPEVQGAKTTEPGTYNFDRMNADLSGFDFSYLVWPEHPGELIFKQDFEAAPEEGEVKLYLDDHSFAYTTRSNPFSFRFKELPEYDEAAEDDHRFCGSAVSFAIYTEDNAYGPALLGCRRVTEADEHAFAIKTLAQAEYIPFSDNETEDMMIRLVACIDNDNGVKDTFAIRSDMYILHYEGEPTEDLCIDAVFTDISVEPIPPTSYFKLLAMAIHYLHAEVLTMADPFNMLRVEDAEAAFAAMEITLEYGDRSMVLAGHENTEAFISFIEGSLTGNGSRWQRIPTLWSCDETETIPVDGAVKVSAVIKDGTNTEELAQFYIDSEGRIWKATDNWFFTSAVRTYDYLSAIVSANFTWCTVDSVPFEQVLAWFDRA